MSTLYELSNQYNFLLYCIDEETGEILPETYIRLKEVQSDFDSKCIDLTKYIKSMQAESDAVEKEQRLMSDRKKKLDKKVQCIKKYLLEQMQSMNISEVKNDQFVIKIRKNPPSVDKDNMDQSLIPYEYKKMSFTWDIQKINQDLRNGIEIPGATLVNKCSLQFS